jgi:hypothetical protein
LMFSWELTSLCWTMIFLLSDCILGLLRMQALIIARGRRAPQGTSRWLSILNFISMPYLENEGTN